MHKPITNHPPPLVTEDIRYCACVCMPTILRAAAATVRFHCRLINKPDHTGHESSDEVEHTQNVDCRLKNTLYFLHKVSRALFCQTVSNCL